MSPVRSILLGMLQRRLFPLAPGPSAPASQAPQGSCVARLERIGGERVLTATGLSSADLSDLVQASMEGPVAVRIRVPTPDRRLSQALEPGLPPPSLRFAALRQARRAGLRAGVLIAPLTAGVNDVECDLARIVDEARRAGAFVAFELGSSTPADDRRLVRDLRRVYPRAAARVEVCRVRLEPAPGAARHRIETTLQRLASAAGVELRMRAPTPFDGPRGGQARFSFAV